MLRLSSPRCASGKSTCAALFVTKRPLWASCRESSLTAPPWPESRRHMPTIVSTKQQASYHGAERPRPRCRSQPVALCRTTGGRGQAEHEKLGPGQAQLNAFARRLLTDAEGTQLLLTDGGTLSVIAWHAERLRPARPTEWGSRPNIGWDHVPDTRSCLLFGCSSASPESQQPITSRRR
jgi:hypothetical protein